MIAGEDPVVIGEISDGDGDEGVLPLGDAESRITMLLDWLVSCFCTEPDKTSSLLARSDLAWGVIALDILLLNADRLWMPLTK